MYLNPIYANNLEWSDKTTSEIRAMFVMPKWRLVSDMFTAERQTDLSHNIIIRIAH
jgi:hypothetical protein